MLTPKCFEQQKIQPTTPFNAKKIQPTTQSWSTSSTKPCNSKVGHMLKLGCSTRNYLLNGPEEDKESESELSVTELKHKRQELITMMEDEKRKKLELIQKEEEERQKQEEERLKREEERGIDWGMGEDADEETDLSENPFAQTMNEELYLDDPKKTLRGYFEREGLELEYDCSEQGMGQFLCKVELPIDDERGRSIYAEALHKGKKKDAVVQCALEACRILDRHGLLRKAIHESRKRKVKNWAENDYYDSDDDTFLDRTGTIEKKREKRMSANIPLKAETYESLLEREQKLHLSIREVENQLTESQKKFSCINNSVAEEDSLDAFMKNLKDSKPDKSTISKLKNELAKLKLEHAKVIKLVNVARPASLPPLIPQYASDINKTNIANSKVMPIFGKRRKIPVSVSHTNTSNCDKFEENEEEEVDDDEQNQEKLRDPQRIVTNPLHPTHVPEIKQAKDEENNLDEIEDGDDITQGEKSIRTDSTVHFDQSLIDHCQGLLEELPIKFKQISSMISQKKQSFSREKQNLIVMMTEKANHMMSEMNGMINEKMEVETVTEKISGADKAPIILVDSVDHGKNKKKNQRRIQQRLEKFEQDKQKGYMEDAQKEDYSMWLPPADQKGDGRTQLNDKYGY